MSVKKRTASLTLNIFGGNVQIWVFSYRRQQGGSEGRATSDIPSRRKLTGFRFFRAVSCGERKRYEDLTLRPFPLNIRLHGWWEALKKCLLCAVYLLLFVLPAGALRFSDFSNVGGLSLSKFGQALRRELLHIFGGGGEVVSVELVGV